MPKLYGIWIVSVLVYGFGSVHYGVMTRQGMWYYRRNSSAWWWLCPTLRTNRAQLVMHTHRRHFVWFDGKQPWITCTPICKSLIMIQSSICCLMRQSTKSHLLYVYYSRQVTLLSSLVTDMMHELCTFALVCSILKFTKESYFLRQTYRWQQFSDWIPYAF